MQRKLVKSPPELWAELSDADSLAHRLGEFGEIRITRIEPETTVAWEADQARGTVEIEPSGWGTQVTLTAEAAGPDPEPVPEPEPDRQPEPQPAPPPAPGGMSFLDRILRRRRPPVVVEPAVEASQEVAAPAPEPDPPPPDDGPEQIDPGRVQDILAGVLDDLGAAHHRPFSRG